MAGMDTDSPVLPLVILLREGGPLTLESDRLAVSGLSLPIREIAWAGVVADRPQPAAGGETSVPGIGLRMREGPARYFVPSDPADATRALDVLATLRPALAATPPPIAGAFAVARPDVSEDSDRPGETPSIVPGSPPGGERLLAAVAHASLVFAPAVLPLIVWLVIRRTRPYAARQAKQAFAYQTLLLGALVSLIVFVSALQATGLDRPLVRWADAGSGLSLALGLIVGVGANLGWILYLGTAAVATRAAFWGKPYHYPLLGWL